MPERKRRSSRNTVQHSTRAGRTAIAQRKFLESFKLHGVIAPAAEAAGVDRTTVWRWQENDEQFALAMRIAREEALDALEHEAYRRAVVGVSSEKPIVYRGEVIDTYKVTEYSDRLLELALKAGRPEKYAERTRSEVSGPGGQPIQIHTHADLSDADLDEKIRTLAETEA